MNNQFSENLKKIRKEHNLSQEQLADELGVSRQAISKWESSSAYPEMDKIIALCDKFNLNIDDLLHKDIKEVKGEEESKNKINNTIKDFLKFITDSVNLFINMSFKSKIKCLFEQFIIILVLSLASNFISRTISSSFTRLISFLPDKIVNFFSNTLDVILTISLLIASVIILVHIFKTRYLDYYVKEDKEKTDEPEEKKEETKKEKIELKKEDKIIIRDPKHSEYSFMNTVLKLIILIIKFFLLCFSLSIVFALIGLFIAFVASFLVIKTGVFFIGLVLAILSSACVAIVILLLILNFVFNRKNNKKMIIWSFIISIITFGIGCGLIFIGTLDFEILDTNETMLTTKIKEYDMQDDLIINVYANEETEYVESDNNNVKIEYTYNKLCTLEEHDNNSFIIAWTECRNINKIGKELLKNANKKIIVPIDTDIEKITVYTTKDNIEKLEKNYNNHYEKEIDEKKDNSEW